MPKLHRTTQKPPGPYCITVCGKELPSEIVRDDSLPNGNLPPIEDLCAICWAFGGQFKKAEEKSTK